MSISRRSLFACIASSAVAPAVAAVPSLATVVASARETEDPELIEIDAEIGPAKQRFEAAEVALDEARERALNTAPPIPDGLAVPYGISIFGQTGWLGLQEPANILGDPIDLPKFVSPRTGRALSVRIPGSQDILSDRRKRSRLTGLPPWQRGEHRRLYDLAVQFERDTEAARLASGIDDAEYEREMAARAIVELCERSSLAEARTIAGVGIKARAIEACSEVPGRAAQYAASYAQRLLPFSLCKIFESEARLAQ